MDKVINLKHAVNQCQDHMNDQHENQGNLCFSFHGNLLVLYY